MKFSDYLSEAKKAKELNLIGMIIHDRKVTEKTPTEKWNVNFICDSCELTSLVGAPEEVLSFSCDYNHLTSLVGAPKTVKSDFSALQRQAALKSLEGLPTFIGNNLYLYNNSISQLHSYPVIVKGGIYFHNNKLKSLSNIHKLFTECGEEFDADQNPIVSNILGILFIEGIKYFRMDYNPAVEKIVNSYLDITNIRKRVMDCQTELIQAGWPEYAKL